MIEWKSYSDFSPTFLQKFHDVVLQDTFHKIQTFILFPLNCRCKGHCLCEDQRNQITLSLNVDFLNQAEASGKSPAFCSAIKSLMEVPNEIYFRAHWNEAYPLWLIQKEFEKREEGNHFKIIDRLVWTLLRLGQTYKESPLSERQASLTEAIELIVGDTPLKTEQSKDYICGERAYGKYLKHYKSVCHFIAAFEVLRQEGQCGNHPFSLNNSLQIERFLQLSDWFRGQLLSLKTLNIKNKSLFSEDFLLPLPRWVNAKGSELSIDPLVERVRDIKLRYHG